MQEPYTNMFLKYSGLLITCIWLLAPRLLYAEPSHKSLSFEGEERPLTIIHWSDLAALPVDSDSLPTASTSPTALPPLPDLGQFSNGLSGDWLPQIDPHSVTQPSAPGSKFSNQLIKIQGFIVPVGYEGTPEDQRVSAFFLVPNFGAILFEAPPPQTQTIYVQLRTPQPIDAITEAYWVTGILKGAKLTKLGTTAQYSMLGLALEANGLDETGEALHP